ncbi:MAG: alpha/beta hydrolase [Thermoguttaceae bacterium]
MIRIFRYSAIVYLSILLILMFLENHLIFIPSRYPSGDWSPAGLEFEDVFFQSADGLKLHGWYVPCESPKATILFCHGNGGNVTHRTNILLKLHELGASVFIFDYRGYGRSEGKPTEAGVLADARAARDWLAKREHIPEKDVVLMGESLGGAVAVDLAAKDGAKALVLISTFSNLPDVAAYHYAFFPVRMLMRTEFNSAGEIAKYHGPILQMHGQADTIVPFKFGRKLYDAANEPKKLIVLPNHDHNDPLPEKFYAALNDFLE